MSFCHQFCKREAIMAEHNDMPVARLIIQSFVMNPKMLKNCLYTVYKSYSTPGVEYY